MYLPFKETDYIQQIVNGTKQPYEYDMLQAMLQRIPKDGVVLDVGMNIANHSLFLAANGYKVFGFEANPKMSAIAKKSIALNGFENKIKVYEMGVSNREEVAHLPKRFHIIMAQCLWRKAHPVLRGGGKLQAPRRP